MRKPISIVLFVIALISTLACVHSRSAAPVKAAVLFSEEQNQAIDQRQNFISVEGTDLKSKWDAALAKARSASPPKAFWTAYTFDVRPGVAVDPGGLEFSGNMQTSGGTSVFIGTSNGMTVETRNLGIFLLRDANSHNVTRMEIYNLERPREYSGYPVYWLGRAGNEESLSFLRTFAEAAQPSSIDERAALAIALHDDPRVSGLLKNYVSKSSNRKVRATSVFWLGQIGGEQNFLAALVRNEQESSDLRRQAAHAIGASKDKTALAILQSLYETLSTREVKRGIIHAVAENENKDAAFNFLLKVAQTDADRESRKQAVHRLGEMDRAAVVDELMKIYAADQDQDIKRTVVHALAENKSPRAQAKILEIARSAESPEVRKHAIHRLGEKNNEAMVDELLRLYDSEQNADVKRHILHAFSEMSSPRAQAKLLAIARNSSESPDVRRQAIHWLGEKDNETSVDELMKIYQAEPSTDVRRQIIHALSEMENARAEDKLFEIARSSDQVEMRRQAIHRIGEKAGQRSLELLRETVDSSSADAQVQVQAVRAISERPADEAVPLLLKIARTHPNAAVRKQAINRLGESGDPRALEFFREVLKNK